MRPTPPTTPTRSRLSALGAGLSSLVLLACGASPPPAQPSIEAPAATAAGPSPSVQAVSLPAPVPSPKEPEVLARDVPPPGVSKLSDDERAFEEKSCKPLVDAIAAAVKRKKPAGAADRNAIVASLLQDPPKLAGVDVGRCADLMLRDLRAYLASAIESEAQMSIGRIVVGLATAMERDPPAVCASAGPVPADLGALAAGPWASHPEDWSAPGWRCARFDLAGQPQRFQYQLVTDTAAGTWEVIARGYPVKGGAPTELYARGRIEGGVVKPSREVYRRAAR